MLKHWVSYSFNLLAKYRVALLGLSSRPLGVRCGWRCRCLYHRAQPPSTFQTQSRPHADDCSHLSTDNSSLVGRLYKKAVQPWQLWLFGTTVCQVLVRVPGLALNISHLLGD